MIDDDYYNEQEQWERVKRWIRENGPWLVAGVVLGVLLAANLESLVHGLERLVGTRFMDASVYLMSDLPAHVELADVSLIAVTAFALCCLSTLYPAWRAARTQPAKALRHD